MTDKLTQISIARQRREPVDAARTYKWLLSLGHTPEEADAVMDADDSIMAKLRKMKAVVDAIEAQQVDDTYAKLDPAGRDAEEMGFNAWRELHGDLAPGEGV